MKININDIGTSIRAARLENGLSQEEVAERTGLSAAHIRHVENGRRKPSAISLLTIAHAVNMSIDSLIFPDNTGSRPLEHEIINLMQYCTEHELIVFIAALRKNKEQRKLQ